MFETTSYPLMASILYSCRKFNSNTKFLFEDVALALLSTNATILFNGLNRNVKMKCKTETTNVRNHISETIKNLNFSEI